MPPKSALQSSFLVSPDAENEVVCPLTNQDGSQCRKRCLGDKRYRSMQEHIRRAHPNYYIPKLPATEESFQLMITTPPSERPQPPPGASVTQTGVSEFNDHDTFGIGGIVQDTTAFSGSVVPNAANAAVALTQLHGLDPDFDVFADTTDVKREYGSLELPSFRDQFSQDALPAFQMTPSRELLPSMLSPTDRYSSLPPIQRRDKIQKPRKSLGQDARKGKHERGKSKDFNAYEFARRLSAQDRKAMSAEPPAAAWLQSKRWEDLIEAATSATDADDDRDLTPMPRSPNLPPVSTSGTSAAATLQAAEAGTNKRSSLPPGFRPLGHLQHQHHHQYNASPLQRALTPPPPDATGPNDPEPFPSVESGESAGSGHQFHISASGLPTSASSKDNTSPLLHQRVPYQHSQSSSFGSRADVLEIYCANCGRPWLLKNAFACTECICGVCSDCVGQIINIVQPGVAPMRRGCPRCGVMGGKWKRFQLDFR